VRHGAPAAAGRHRTALRSVRALAAALALWTACLPPAGAEDFATFSSKGLPGSQGIEVRLRHPARWKQVPLDDPMALAELRGPHGRLTGIVQVGRGRQRGSTEGLCRPDRARTMLQQLAPEDADARVTDVVARTSAGRPGYEVRYERNHPPDHLRVHSVIVCLKDSRVVVSCGAIGPARAALADIGPVCTQVLESLSISED
jgi:hypothetical protein